jgi:gliding motility-associated-like protein
VTATLGNCTVSAGYHIDQCQFKMILPNTITPSRSDGLNEEFYIPEQVQQSINDFEIRIFNRWGEQVFYSTDKGFRWNGEYKGKINYDEVYTYVIHCLDANGKSHVYKGVITIL